MLRATSLRLTSITETPSQVLVISAQIIKTVFSGTTMPEAHFLVFDFICPVLELAVFPDVSGSLAEFILICSVIS